MHLEFNVNREKTTGSCDPISFVDQPNKRPTRPSVDETNTITSGMKTPGMDAGGSQDDLAFASEHKTASTDPLTESKHSS